MRRGETRNLICTLWSWSVANGRPLKRAAAHCTSPARTHGRPVTVPWSGAWHAAWHDLERASNPTHPAGGGGGLGEHCACAVTMPAQYAWWRFEKASSPLDIFGCEGFFSHIKGGSVRPRSNTPTLLPTPPVAKNVFEHRSGVDRRYTAPPPSVIRQCTSLNGTFLY